MKNRPELDTVYMMLALTWATRSTCTARAKVGAVLVSRDNRVIAAGYNGAPHGQVHCDDTACDLDADGHCKRAIHAEENVILQCAAHGISTKDSVIYVTHKPCERCSRRLLQAGVDCAFYLFDYGGDYNTGFSAYSLYNNSYDAMRKDFNELLREIHKNIKDGG